MSLSFRSSSENIGVIERGLDSHLFFAAAAARVPAEVVDADGGIFSGGCCLREKIKGEYVAVDPCPGNRCSHATNTCSSPANIEHLLLVQFS